MVVRKFQLMLFVSINICSQFVLSGCSSPDSGSDRVGVQSLSLAEGGLVKSKFIFPNNSQQLLSAPTGHAIEGASLLADSQAFQKDMEIEIAEALGLTDSWSRREMGATEALSAAGPAIVVQTQKPVDSDTPMQLTIPVKTQESASEGKNLVIVYRALKERIGGKTVVGMIHPSQISRGEKTAQVQVNHFGVYQAAWYSGDPSRVIERASLGPILSLDAGRAQTPEDFFIRTPSGTVIGQLALATWSASKNAIYYDVNVSSDSECQNLVRKYPAVTNQSRSLESLAEGKMFICVDAVSKSGVRTPAKNNGLEFALKANTLGSFGYSTGKSFATLTPRLTWTSSEGAQSYLVTIGTSINCQSNAIESANVKDSFFVPRQIRSDGVYFLCVQAFSEHGHKVFMNPDTGRAYGEGIQFTVDSTAPGQFDILGIGGPNLNLSWSASSEAAYYNIKLSTQENCDSPFKTFERMSAQLTSLRVPGLSEGQSYSICLEAVDQAGNVRSARNSKSRFLFDTVKPSIVAISSSPSTGLFTVGQKIDISLKFSEPVKSSGAGKPALKLNINASAPLLSGVGTDTLTFQYTVKSSENTSALDYSSRQGLELESVVLSDFSGNQLVATLPEPGSPQSLSGVAKIAVDTILPSVLKTIPALDARDVAVNSEVVVQFSEDIDQESMGAISILKSSDGSNVTANFQVNRDSRNAKFTPKANQFMTANTAYQVVVKGARDLAGNTMSEYVLKFTTK
ncbi:MAG: Ig-like domain-containing protein [Proteobacteria bacterium]|nr:Ig-like domain-containing protein [Pseudomonadota bacterium]